MYDIFDERAGRCFAGVEDTGSRYHGVVSFETGEVLPRGETLIDGDVGHAFALELEIDEGCV